MKRGSLVAKYSFRATTQSTYSRAITALLVAMLAVLIDSIFRFNDYRALLHWLPVAGTMKFSYALTLAFLQVVALFYLVLLLPIILRTVVLLLSIFIIVVQLSYWLTLSQFMTSTDVFLDLMGVPMSLRVLPYDKSIFSLTDEDNRVRYYISGSLHGFGDYVVKMIPTPLDEGWGVSRPLGNSPKSE